MIGESRECAESVEQKVTFGRVLGQCQGRLIGLGRLRHSTESAQEIPPGVAVLPLSGDGAVLDDAWAKKNDINVGDRIIVRTALERPQTLVAKGTVKDNADLLGNLVVTDKLARSAFAVREPSMTFIKLADGTDAALVQDVATGSPGARVGLRPHRRPHRPRRWTTSGR